MALNQEKSMNALRIDWNLNANHSPHDVGLALQLEGVDECDGGGSHEGDAQSEVAVAHLRCSPARGRGVGC